MLVKFDRNTGMWLDEGGEKNRTASFVVNFKHKL